MEGLHLTADLRGCAAALPPMTGVAALRALCLAAVAEVELQAVGELFHGFGTAATAAPGGSPPVTGGVTGVVLLAESHLAVHTWPERGAVTLDVYVCNLGADNGARAERLMQRLVAAFAPARVERQALRRGGAVEAA
ncbi:S-adenosylmethionine decarboxylase family protein [Piscinibacter sakaiensis]|uniref:S-adenosylmethionine decarboxylase proenzyme n=1 Tax=Piscinibacter sakaiensis TaxID=1547922 RepID=A0A0K8NVQ8_PISS1|nr:S-adenosylmethionine decarboxylase [Piscinibacter sakaiensis]GAP34477.1 S-adenosylmethionine decarboxylase proenzyme [Piscinibacter sakaiensis]